MRRPLLSVLAFALLSPGCVPVTEPLGDIEKAEPDKNFIGIWERDEGGGDVRAWVVDRPEVKGNPNGLMRLRVIEKGKLPEDAKERATVWFFTTTLGKHTYANVLLAG